GTGHWQRFGLPDQLASIRVLSMVQDSQGYLWFGSDGWGVFRFDGVNLVRFTEDDGLPDNRVDAILESSDGFIWVLTGEGACRLEGRRFERLSVRRGDEASTRWEGHLAEDADGTIWFGTNTGIQPDSGSSLPVVEGLSDDHINSMAFGPDGTLLVASNTGLALYAGGNRRSLDQRDGLPDSLVTTVVPSSDGSTWLGSRHGAVRIYGQRLDTFTTRDGLIHNSVNSILEDRNGNIWFGTDGGVSRYDGELWTNYTTEDGLVDNRVYVILEDHEGYLWFGTDGGVSRFDRNRSVTYDVDDGVPAGRFTDIAEGRDGSLWFATENEGVLHYKAGQFLNSKKGSGLASNRVNTILIGRDGTAWLGTDDGVSRFDGKNWRTYSPRHGLSHRSVNDIIEDRSGVIWFATNGGISRLEEESWTSFTIATGLPHNVVWTLRQDGEGIIWAGTAAGAGYFDGGEFVAIDPEKSLGRSPVRSILPDRYGALWFVIPGRGVIRYHNGDLTPFSVSDGLAGERITSALIDNKDDLWFGAERGVSRFDGRHMHEMLTGSREGSRSITTMLNDRSGRYWFGTRDGGIIQYADGMRQRLFRQDGLADDTIDKMIQDSLDNIWIATPGGITKFRPVHSRPPIVITGVTTDSSHDLSQTISFPSSESSIRFDFVGISYKTRPEQMLYRYQLIGHDPEERTTNARQVSYVGLPRGDYTFRVSAVDLDLGTSDSPAEIGVAVHLPYGTLALSCIIGLIVLAGGLAARSAGQRRRERDDARKKLEETQDQLFEAMARELQAAHDVQMSLLPQSSPDLPGFDIAGVCIPANQVGGDHYTYQWVDKDHQFLALVVADVAGKEMKAAMTVMRFSEVLFYEIRNRQDPDAILQSLNDSLAGRMDSRLYVTACVGVLDVGASSFTVANAGHPPVYRRTGDGHVSELTCTGHPLGLRPGVSFETSTTELVPGDVLVLYSDGVYEARNHLDRDYGFDRLRGTISRLGAKGNAGEILERIVSDVKRFVGTASLDDDITVVVVKVEGKNKA
ncbi:MAG: SpoIIE family protein phosphatase, partial [Candidatus Latescibacteria bacterium]|nr:SpoIIE family protein phosphatase [Candidatus Latescibacterota bacterium]